SALRTPRSRPRDEAAGWGRAGAAATAVVPPPRPDRGRRNRRGPVFPRVAVWASWPPTVTRTRRGRSDGSRNRCAQAGNGDSVRRRAEGGRRVPLRRLRLRDQHLRRAPTVPDVRRGVVGGAAVGRRPPPRGELEHRVTGPVCGPVTDSVLPSSDWPDVWACHRRSHSPKSLLTSPHTVTPSTRQARTSSARKIQNLACAMRVARLCSIFAWRRARYKWYARSTAVGSSGGASSCG